MKQLIPLFFSLVLSTVQAMQFQAPLTKTQWQVDASPLSCTLKQQIHGFGEAKFTQGTGEDFSLIFTTHTHPSMRGKVNFEIAQAPWQNSEERLPLASTASKEHQTEFVLSGDLAKQAFTYIQEGQFPTLRYHSYNANKEISVLFSTIHLADSIYAFKQCLADLHPDTFDMVRKLTIYFTTEKADLSEEAQASLMRLADYVKIDDEVKQISIDGYTDNFGRKRLNIALSEARAVAIKNFLTENCQLPESLITTAFHREFNPAKSNKTTKGRAYNRRAEIELHK